MEQRERQSGDDVSVRFATAHDAPGITAIYNHYIAETVVTFEEETVPPSDFERRMKEIEAASMPWLVAERDGAVVGYAYAGPWKKRTAYRFSAEVTVYLAPGQERRGIGTRLYNRLFPMLKERGVHVAIGGIALPNEGSVALHERFGMKKVAHFEEVGFKFGRWIDVGYWQCTL